MKFKRIMQIFNKNRHLSAVRQTDKAEEFERCIICGELTNVLVSTPVDWRENYEVGIGQICTDCANKKSGVEDKSLTNKQIMLAVKKSTKKK